MRRGARASRGFVGLALLSALGCGPVETAAPRPDVIVVVLDTLRVDRTSVFDRERETTPFLAELAERSVVFDNAWSTSSWTAPAVASLFTGLYPSQHGVDVGVWLFQRLKDDRPQLRLKRIPEALETLPEAFRASGYTTFGIADNPNISSAEGFASGFDRFASADYRGAAEVNALLERWQPEIERASPAFVYLHYMDAHWPYHAHVSEPGGLEGEVPETPEAEVAAYDAELRHLDDHLRRALSALDPNGDAVVVIVSDHGEELYERGDAMEHRQHGFQLYDELSRVLWLLRDPAEAGQRRATPASLVDVLPTLRARVGLPADPNASGIDLLGPRGEGAAPDRPLFASRREVVGPDRVLRAVVHQGWKYLRIESTSEASPVREELYDLRGDPAERRDLSQLEPDRLASLRAQLRDFDRAARRWQPEDALLDVSPEQADRLRALGYAEPEERPPPQTRESESPP